MKIKKITTTSTKLKDKYLEYYQIEEKNIYYNYEDLDDGNKIYQLKETADFLKNMAENKKMNEVLIIGDYDVDGITSSSFYYLFFKEKYGIEVNVYIPEREKDGYGLQTHLVEQAYKDGFKYIITVDNGITAFEAVDRANELGLEVIITDHHTIQNEKVPNAKYVVNPLTPQTTFREKHLAGVGVIFMILKEIDEVVSRKFLSLVAIGTIADVMPMTNDNRAIIREGLKQTPSNIGLRLLYTLVNDQAMEVRTRFLDLTSSDIGFTIAPLINSSGRYNKPMLGFKMLTTNDEEEAKILFKKLKDLNSKRKKNQKEFELYILQNRKLDKNKHGYIIEELEDFKFDASINGIIASKILEKTQKPVLILSKKKSKDSNEEYYSGSGRSLNWFDLGNFIEKIKTKGYLIRGGGHKVAAGISIYKDSLKNVMKIFEEETKKVYQTPKKEIDVLDIIKVPNIKKDFKKILQNIYTTLLDLEPFGTDFPKPKIAFEFESYTDLKELGKEKTHYSYLIGGHKVLKFNMEKPKKLNKIILGDIQRNTFTNEDGLEIEYFSIIDQTPYNT